MPIADTKKVQSFIQGILVEIAKLESADTELQSLKTKYQNHNPDLTDSNLTSQQVSDANALLNGLNTLLSDHASIITTLKDKDFPSHGTGALG